jgi:hypothetical protein
LKANSTLQALWTLLSKNILENYASNIVIAEYHKEALEISSPLRQLKISRGELLKIESLGAKAVSDALKFNSIVRVEWIDKNETLC